MVLVYYTFQNVCYQCLKSKVDGFCSLEVMVQKKIKVKINKGKILNMKILSVAELWFLFTALLHNVFYLCMNLKVDSSDKNSK